MHAEFSKDLFICWMMLTASLDQLIQSVIMQWMHYSRQLRASPRGISRSSLLAQIASLSNAVIRKEPPVKPHLQTHPMCEVRWTRMAVHASKAKIL